MKKILEKIGNLDSGWILGIAAIIGFSIMAFAPNTFSTPELPITQNKSIEKIGSLNYAVDVYKVTTDGLDFLVIVNGNKGGVAVTRIK